MRTRNGEGGFTLIEITAVLFLIALMAAITLPSFGRGAAGVEARLCRDQLRRDLRAARAEAIGKMLPTSVKFSSSSYTMDLGDGDPLERELPEGFTLDEVSLGAGQEMLVFAPDGGTNGAEFSLGTKDRTYRFRVREDGGLDWR